MVLVENKTSHTLTVAEKLVSASLLLPKTGEMRLKPALHNFRLSM